jgi:hypothetical protein
VSLPNGLSALVYEYHLTCQTNRKNIRVWNWWAGDDQEREIKSTFGMFNLYGPATKDNGITQNPVEKQFADLECAMGVILKKLEDTLTLDEEEPGVERSVPLGESEVNTTYKFIALSFFRNGPYSLCLDAELSVSLDPTQVDFYEQWIFQLEFLLKYSHHELVDMDELQQPPVVRSILARYKQIGMMKLQFWTAPKENEFLLNNFLVGLEGYQHTIPGDSSSVRYPAHIYLSASPKLLAVLCSDSLCRESMLRNVPHPATTPYDRPAKGKPRKTSGPKKYQAVVPNWKRTYHIPSISVDDLDIVNGRTLAVSNTVVYKSHLTLNRAIDKIIPVAKWYKEWESGIEKPTVKPPSEEEAVIPEQMREVQYLMLGLMKSYIRPLIDQCEEEVREEFKHHVEIIEKAVYYMFDGHEYPYTATYFMTGTLSMGHGKVFGRHVSPPNN